MLKKLSLYLPAALIFTLAVRHSHAQTATDQTLGISPIAQQVGNRMMPNLYYFYSDPAYKLGATQQGYKSEVVQQMVQAMKGITQPVNAAYGDYCSAPNCFVGPASERFVGKRPFGQALSWVVDREVAERYVLALRIRERSSCDPAADGRS